MRPSRAVIFAALLLGGCTTEKISYVTRPPFNPPPDTLNGFLGYFTVADKQTTCGNCHVSHQQAWAQTGHSHAWSDLQSSGHASASCNGCHTVSQNGNAVVGAAGYLKVADSAYHDVQCESCHGPGFNHVQNPEVVQNQPLASIHLDTVTADPTLMTNGCGECHSGTHNPFLEEWTASKHGPRDSVYFYEGQRDPCQNCHEGRRALQINFAGLDPRQSGQTGGDVGVYVEANQAGNLQPLGCAVCHDPHDNTNDPQLRAPLGVNDITQVCAHCHRREGAAQLGKWVPMRRGPHGAQGLVVMDEDVGWKPAGWDSLYPSPLQSSHAAANPAQCAACHMASFNIANPASGAATRYTGHLFEAIPCLDPVSGAPIAGGSCSDAQRYFGGCAVSGCHGSPGAAQNALDVVRARMNYLTDQLWTDADGDGVLDTLDAGLLPQVLKKAIAAGNFNEMNLYDSTTTVAEGAIWNAQLASTGERPQWLNFKIQGQNSCAAPGCTTKGGSNTGHPSSGDGSHNPFLLEALLVQSIKAVQSTYGLSLSPTVNLTVQLQAPAAVTLH